jgi:bifunctional ADP-heptose synthase (sugar kinase/adenylyltransferase)
MEAAIFSNHAAGVVVGKVGTAAVSPEELLQSFKNHR